MSKILKHRNYFHVAKGNLELIRGDIWDLVITKWPTAVYNPGDDILKTRLKTVDPGVTLNINIIEKEIFGHSIHQNAGRGSQKASMTLNFIDKEDQAITYTTKDWMDQIADPDTNFGRHVSELIFECSLVFYNTRLQPIRSIEFYKGIFKDPQFVEGTQERGTDISEVTWNIDFEHHHRNVL